MRPVLLLLSLCGWMTSIDSGAALSHPHLLVTGDKKGNLRSVDDVRRDIRSGITKKLWGQLVAKVEREGKEPPIIAGKLNRNYSLVVRTCNRITDGALVALVRNDRGQALEVLEQIEVLFDETKWPEWSDQAHLDMGFKSDLRHGQLAWAIGYAYDWTYQLLTSVERRRIVDGLDRYAIKPFQASVAAKEGWIYRQSNWKTCNVGGFGVLGMALGDDHPEAKWLVEFAEPLMDKYMEVFGPDGEFNESPQYATSSDYVVGYFLARHYANGGRSQPEQLQHLGKFGRWFLYCILPPDRMMAFGDGHAYGRPNVSAFSGVAAGLRDPVTQWMYLRYAKFANVQARTLAQEILYFDPLLKPESPADRLPLGRYFPAQSGIVASRSDWVSERPVSIAYAKASREDFHGHADWGQVCLDGFGERLIVDNGSPEVYPRARKWQYYNYQQSAHNVLAFGESELDVDVRVRRHGKMIRSEFDDQKGGAWSFDLSEVYAKGRQVRRHVIHLLPRILVVLDEAESPAAERIRLRWHTSEKVAPDAKGNFAFEHAGVGLSAHVASLEGKAEIGLGRHEYRPPYHKDRMDRVYRQRHEPFVELRTRSNRFRSLSLFSVFGSGEKRFAWERNGNEWKIQTPEGVVMVSLADARLSARSEPGHSWEIPLASP